MIYFEDKEIQIRDMAPEDAQTITDEEVAQGWATRRSMRRSWLSMATRRRSRENCIRTWRIIPMDWRSWQIPDIWI